MFSLADIIPTNFVLTANFGKMSLGNLGQTCEIAIMNSSPGKRYMMASSEEIKRPDR